MAKLLADDFQVTLQVRNTYLTQIGFAFLLTPYSWLSDSSGYEHQGLQISFTPLSFVLCVCNPQQCQNQVYNMHP